MHFLLSESSSSGWNLTTILLCFVRVEVGKKWFFVAQKSRKMVNARIFLGNGRKKKFIQGTVSTTVSYNKCFLYGRPKKQTNCHGHFDRFSLALTLLSPPRIPGFACVLARGLLFSRAEEEEEDIVINLPREKEGKEQLTTFLFSRSFVVVLLCHDGGGEPYQTNRLFYTLLTSIFQS